ncbi:hypothetical protein FNL55_12795 [Tardiphaga sp. vice352]|uniref:hypothetical protein n=1 Tax=Tardiphaga sp. vice352 TaxID=2592816 RepID=UPI0011657114|nr:hypothetical protein [Tardiphaga sp. vice352]QDM32117.1 hypothetical protein FNL55_12795 [Tardiphaga sp. vice352]
MPEQLDVVDDFYIEMVRPLDNLVIIFAQAEAALVEMIIDLTNVDESVAQRMIKSKEEVLQLINRVDLECFDRTELPLRIEQFWCDRDLRNRYIHDEWFPQIDEGGAPATRGLPLKKGAEVVWNTPIPDDVWALARRFNDHRDHFSHIVYSRQRMKSSDSLPDA